MRIRAVVVQAGTVGLAGPGASSSPACSVSLGCREELSTASRGVNGCVCSEVVPLGRQPRQQWESSTRARAGDTNGAGCSGDGCSGAGCAPSQRGAGAETWTALCGGVREGPMGWAGSTSQGQLAASTCPVTQGGPRCPEAPRASPCASRLRRAVPPAAADGGCQLRSVTFLADPVISISRRVLKSSWKPARWQPRQQLPHGMLGLRAQPALVCRGGGGWPALVCYGGGGWPALLCCGGGELPAQLAACCWSHSSRASFCCWAPARRTRGRFPGVVAGPNPLAFTNPRESLAESKNEKAL